MMQNDPDPYPPPDNARGVAFAVITAAATVLVTGLISWGVDELRNRYGSRPPEPPKDTKP